MSVETDTAGQADTLSPLSRLLIRVMSVLFLALGLVLFLVPGWASANFLWKVSPFVAMTMGGWYLGNAYAAWEASRVRRWQLIYSNMIMLWLFSLLEAFVLILFSANLRPGAALGWPYMAVIAAAALISLIGVADWVRLRPAAPPVGHTSSRFHMALIAFTVAVFLIALFPILGYGKSGQIFPEPLTPFTLRAFGFFYLSIAVGTVPLLFTRSLATTLVYARSGLGFLYTITLAALLNLDKFNFAERPTQFIYLGVYLLVGATTTLIVLRHRSRSQPVEAVPPAVPA